MKITVICENYVLPSVRAMGEHGLSLLIESDETTLFDTGNGLGLMYNLDLFGKNPDSIDRIILSHGHYDHTGGLMSILKSRRRKMPVWIHPDAFLEKIVIYKSDGEEIIQTAGFPYKKRQYEKHGAIFKSAKRKTEICKEIQSFSDVKRPEGWISWDTRLKQKREEHIIDDPFNDDLSLLLETASGPVVLLGCAHAGIVEILDFISEETGHKTFHAVIGGTHLANAPEEYIKKAVLSLKKYKVNVIATAHCTGFKVNCYMADIFKDKYYNASVGSSFEF